MIRPTRQRPRLSIVVNSSTNGVLAPRVKCFATGLAKDFEVDVVWRETTRARAILASLGRLRRFRPDLVYLVDLGYAAVFASIMYQCTRSCALVIETGDPLPELLWSNGRVGRGGRAMVRRYERAVLRRADHVVVRGSGLQDYLARLDVTRVDTVPDGVDLALFCPMEASELRHALVPNGCTAIGVMGSLNWSKRLRWGYGSELIEVLTMLRNLPLCGIVVGDGPGRAILERQAAARGLEDRIRFVGQIPYESLPPYINAMDICLSTQTNDAVGRSRTTAKLHCSWPAVVLFSQAESVRLRGSFPTRCWWSTMKDSILIILSAWPSESNTSYKPLKCCSAGRRIEKSHDQSLIMTGSCRGLGSCYCQS